MDPFAGKVAIVTGAASGIGLALSTELARRGAIVYGADRDAAGLERLAGPTVHTAQLDVTDEDAVKALIDRAVDEQGRIDYLFNNAGIVVGGRFQDMDMATWRTIVDVNFWGVVYGTQHGYARMIEQGHGHIVNTASTAGVTPVAKSTAYAATKHAVVGLSISLRPEARRYGVRVSVVIPGMIDTNIFDTAMNVGGHDYKAAMDKVPFRKISPAQAARSILDGVERNREFVTFPRYNRVLIHLYRMFPRRMSRIINSKT